MKNESIIAAWMSPIKLYEFTACNLVLNITVILIRCLLGILNTYKGEHIIFHMSDVANKMFVNTFKLYGIGIFSLGITLCILGNVCRLGGIEKKRFLHLIILGTVNLLSSIYLLWR